MTEAAHFTIDVGSFLSAPGVDSTADARAAWADIAGAGEPKASVQHFECTPQHDTCSTMPLISMQGALRFVLFASAFIARRADAQTGPPHIVTRVDTIVRGDARRLDSPESTGQPS